MKLREKKPCRYWNVRQVGLCECVLRAAAHFVVNVDKCAKMCDYLFTVVPK